MSSRTLNRTQWDALCGDLAEQVKSRWPSLKVSSSILSGVEVSLQHTASGSASLRGTDESDDVYVPVVRLGSSSTYPSSILHARARHDEMRVLLEALSFLERETSGIRVSKEAIL